MSSVRFVVAASVVWLCAAAPAAGEVRLVVGGGVVSIDATNATLREILGEWERVGRTRIFNADRVGGGPLTIRLDSVPEERALEILLRNLNGYVAAPRRVPADGASQFDRIMLMPGTARPRSAVSAPPAPAGNDAAIQAPAQAEDEDPGGERPVRVIPSPGQRGTAFRGFPSTSRPSSEDQPPPARPVYTPQPSMPAGVPVPGMIVPVPEDPDPRAAEPTPEA